MRKINRAGITHQLLTESKKFQALNKRLPTVRELSELTGTSIYTAKYRVQMIRQELQISICKQGNIKCQ